ASLLAPPPPPTRVGLAVLLGGTITGFTGFAGGGTGFFSAAGSGFGISFGGTGTGCGNGTGLGRLTLSRITRANCESCSTDLGTISGIGISLTTMLSTIVIAVMTSARKRKRESSWWL